MTESMLVILGADNPEMQAIEQLLKDCGVDYAYAIGADGERVHPGNAYKVDRVNDDCPDVRFDDDGGTVVEVECRMRPRIHGATYISIDHHNPGDPGYGKPPAEFLSASSIGQVISLLGQRVEFPADWVRVAVSRHPHWCGAIEKNGDVWVTRTTSRDGDPGDDDDRSATACVIPNDIILAAAADHCLAAAYRGECPGVDPDELMAWRIESKAQHPLIWLRN